MDFQTHPLGTLLHVDHLFWVLLQRCGEEEHVVSKTLACEAVRRRITSAFAHASHLLPPCHVVFQCRLEYCVEEQIGDWVALLLSPSYLEKCHFPYSLSVPRIASSTNRCVVVRYRIFRALSMETCGLLKYLLAFSFK